MVIKGIVPYDILLAGDVEIGGIQKPRQGNKKISSSKLEAIIKKLGDSVTISHYTH